MCRDSHPNEGLNLQRLGTLIKIDLQSLRLHPSLARYRNELGVYVVGGTPEHFANAIRTDIAKWAKIIKEAGIRLD